MNGPVGFTRKVLDPGLSHGRRRIVEAVRKAFREGRRNGHLLAAAAAVAVWQQSDSSAVVLLLTAIGFMALFIYKRTLAVCTLLIFVGMWANAAIRDRPTALTPADTVWTGTIVWPEIDGDRLKTDFRTAQNETVRLVYTMKSEEEKRFFQRTLKPGVVCFVNGSLEKPQAPTNFYAFDYPAYLKHKGIHWVLNAESVLCCRSGRPGLIDRIKRLRQAGVSATERELPEPLAGLVNALVYGDRSAMDPNVLTAYQNLGLVHLLAVSGLHVSLIAGAVYYLLLRAGFLKEHVRLFMALVLLPAYAILTGLVPSVCRAALMLGFQLLAPFLKSKPSPPAALALSALLQLFLSPGVLFDIGFELSYLVTLAIIVSAPTISRRHANFLVRTFAMTGIAQLATLPLIAFYFYGFSLLGFFLNVFYIPFITFVILPLSLAAAALSPVFPALRGPLEACLSLMVGPAHAFLTKLDERSLLYVTTGRPGTWLMLGLIILVLALLMLWEKLEGAGSLFLPFIGAVLIGALAAVVSWISPVGSVTFLDVGQGDSIFIQLPHARGNVLIDTGGRLPIAQKSWQRERDQFNIGRDIVCHELKAMGVRRIDRLVLTHRDFDHIEGLEGLIGCMPIRQLIVARPFTATKTEWAWFQKARALGVQLVRVSPGVRWGAGSETFQVLWPYEKTESTNGQSLVLFARLGGSRWLFTGDLDREGELELIKRHPNLKIDMLKVGHHGSRTSSAPAFIDAIAPRLAVISVGAHNRYGHPHEEVLKIFRDRRIPVMRTDRSGAIRIVFDARHIVGVETATTKK